MDLTQGDLAWAKEHSGALGAGTVEEINAAGFIVTIRYADKNDVSLDQAASDLADRWSAVQAI